MHYVEAYLAPGVHLRSHTTRDKFVASDSILRKVYKEYQDLKFFGYNSRYEICNFKASDVSPIATTYLDKIKSAVAPHL